MRISKERQAARLRITKMKLAMTEAVDNMPGSTTEYIMALAELLQEAQNRIIISETPGPDEQGELLHIRWLNDDKPVCETPNKDTFVKIDIGDGPSCKPCLEVLRKKNEVGLPRNRFGQWS